ncbi:MAG TPA: hypothetical protein VG692_13160, partial [Gemmatimonadales bacterium]|nr:hypothetical protein [Gemmatimonadales bacterium]
GHALRAELARQRGRLTEALAEIQKCDLGTTAWYITTNPHWGVRERFLMAEILRALGRDAEALDVYESFVGQWDTPYMAPAHRAAAAIYARRGDIERAAFHEGRYRGLWGTREGAHITTTAAEAVH